MIKFSDRKCKALRFLLLRHMEYFQNSLKVNTYDEITKSLKINLNDNNYIIEWIKEGKNNKINIEQDKFIFYSRGDIKRSNKTINESLKENNQINAEICTREIFGLNKNTKKDVKKVFHKKILIFEFMINFMSTTGLSLYIENLKVSCIFFIVHLCSFISNGKIISTAVFITVSFHIPSFAILICCIGNLFITYLDTEFKLKLTRYICSFIGIFNCYEYLSYFSLNGNFINLICIGAFCLVFVYNFSYGVHKSMFNLMSPFFVFSFYSESILLVFLGLIVISLKFCLIEKRFLRLNKNVFNNV